MPEFSFSPSTKILHFLLCDFILEMVLIHKCNDFRQKEPILRPTILAEKHLYA